MKGNNGGQPTAYDRKLAGEVRNLTLGQIKKIYDKDPEMKEEFTKQMFLRLAPLAIPRLNEHSGRDGEPLFPEPIYGAVSRHNGNSQDFPAIKTDSRG